MRKIWAVGITTASPADEGSTAAKQKYSDKGLGEPLVKAKGRKGPRVDGSHGAGCTWEQTQHLRHHGGRGSGMVDTGQSNARSGHASSGQQALSRQQSGAFFPAVLKHLAPPESRENWAGKGPGGQLAWWGFVLRIWRPPRGFPVVVRTPGW